MSTMTPREAADALAEDELDARYADDPRLNMLIAWAAVRAQHRADPARLLARMDAARTTDPPVGGDLAALADDERVRRLVAGFIDQAWRAGVSGEIGAVAERVDAFSRGIRALSSKEQR